MFDYIRGNVEYIDPEYVTLDVSGIGFKIYTSAHSAGSVKEGETATFYTILNVREDALDICGFTTREELSVFKILLNVGGVGMKLGMAILSGMTPAEFSLAVMGDNSKAFTGIKGVGSKLAQKIIIDSKDKIKKANIGDAAAGKDDKSARDAFFGGSSVYDEAVEALMVLGFNAQKAKSCVGSVYQDGMTLEAVVKQALKQ